MTWLALLTNRWVQLAAGTAMALILGFGLGHHQKTLEDASAQLRVADKAVKAVAASAAATSVIDQHTAAVLSQSQTATTTLLQKVPIYVTKHSDDQCIVGAGAVRLLDAAALNTVPGPAVSLPDEDPGVAGPDADSGVKLSDVVQADIVNAGSYRQAVAKGDAWDAWYDAVNPEWKKAHPAP